TSLTSIYGDETKWEIPYHLRGSQPPLLPPAHLRRRLLPLTRRKLMGVDMLPIDPRFLVFFLNPVHYFPSQAMFTFLTPLNQSRNEAVMFLSFITPFSGSKGTNEARNYRNGSHNSLTPPKDAKKEKGTNARVGEPKPNMETRLRNAVSKLFKLLMPTEKYTTGVKNMVLETLSSAKIEGFVDGFRGETKAARTEKTVDK
ncbi:hypothetical protein HID58_064276, partial [Brassica napus]